LLAIAIAAGLVLVELFVSPLLAMVSRWRRAANEAPEPAPPTRFEEEVLTFRGAAAGVALILLVAAALELRERLPPMLLGVVIAVATLVVARLWDRLRPDRRNHEG
jgi:hypothetical protein